MKLRSMKLVPFLVAVGAIGLICILQSLPRFFPEDEKTGEPQYDVFQRLRWITYDWRVKLASRFSQEWATNLAGVFIDDSSIGEINSGRYGYYEMFPWPRHFYGRVVSELAAQGAMAVGFDILFDQLDPRDKEVELADKTKIKSDEFFAQALRRAGNVVLAAESESEVFPAPLFETNSMMVANISAKTDSDGILRRVQAYKTYREWHPAIKGMVVPLSLDLSNVQFETNRIRIARKGEEPWEVPLLTDGSLNMEELAGEASATPQYPYYDKRVWHMGIVLAAKHLGLDLTNAVVQPDRIIFKGPQGRRRIIPVDTKGRFYVDWALSWKEKDSQAFTEDIVRLIREYDFRQRGETNVVSRFEGKLVVIGSVGAGNNISDKGATPLESDTQLVVKHWNVANSIIMNRFIQPSSANVELALVLIMGMVSAFLTLRQRVLSAAFWVFFIAALYTLLSVVLFIAYRYWAPLVVPVGGGLVLTHFSMVLYRVVFEQKEQRRVKGVFSKMVAPEVVNELLSAENLELGGARRKVTVFFADVRGFTQFTDDSHQKAEEHVRKHNLSEKEAEAYFDAQAAEALATVNLYLATISNTIKKHRGTLDKYIGDCVMGFWGAPIPNEKHALCCVQAAIDAQRGMAALNVERDAENKRRAAENKAREASGQPPWSMLPLLTLGSGINTGTVTVGLMGSKDHLFSYTVFGREVNVASRLEGISGRGRIIISEVTYKHLQRDDPALAATCVELPPVTVKGIRQAVKIFEVPWKQATPSPERTAKAPETAAVAPPSAQAAPAEPAKV